MAACSSARLPSVLYKRIDHSISLSARWLLPSLNLAILSVACTNDGATTSAPRDAASEHEHSDARDANAPESNDAERYHHADFSLLETGVPVIKIGGNFDRHAGEARS